MKKKVLVMGLVFVTATLIIGIIGVLPLMISRGANFESIWGEGGWIQYLFTYSIFLPIWLLMHEAGGVFSLKIPLTILVIVLIVLSIRMHKLWLSIVAYTLWSLYWLFLVYGSTGIPLD